MEMPHHDIEFNTLEDIEVVVGEPEYVVAYHGPLRIPLLPGPRRVTGQLTSNLNFVVLDDRQMLADALLVAVEGTDDVLNQLLRMAIQHSPRVLCVDLIDDIELPDQIGNALVIPFDDHYIQRITNILECFVPLNSRGLTPNQVQILTAHFIKSMNFDQLIALLTLPNVDQMQFLLSDIFQEHFYQRDKWPPQVTPLGKYLQHIAENEDCQQLITSFMLLCLYGPDHISRIDRGRETLWIPEWATSLFSGVCKKAVSAIYAMFCGSPLHHDGCQPIAHLHITPLMIAVLLGHEERALQNVESLLNKNNNPLFSDCLGFTALSLALKFNRARVAHCLANSMEQHSTAVEISPHTIPVLNTALETHVSIDLFEQLLRISDATQVDVHGLPAIHRAVLMEPRYLAKLVEYGADPNQPNPKTGDNALHIFLRSIENEDAPDTDNISEKMFILCLAHIDFEHHNHSGQIAIDSMFEWSTLELLEIRTNLLEIVSGFLSEAKLKQILLRYSEYLRNTNAYNFDHFSKFAAPLLSNNCFPLHMFPASLIPFLEEGFPASFTDQAITIATAIVNEEMCDEVIHVICHDGEVDEVTYGLYLAACQNNVSAFESFIHCVPAFIDLTVNAPYVYKMLLFCILHSSEGVLELLLKQLLSKNAELLHRWITETTYRDRSLLSFTLSVGSTRCSGIMLIYLPLPILRNAAEPTIWIKKSMFNSYEMEDRLILSILGLKDLDRSLVWEWALNEPHHQRLFVLDCINHTDYDMFLTAIEFEFQMDFCRHFVRIDSRRDRLDDILAILPEYLQSGLVGNLNEMDDSWHALRDRYITSGYREDTLIHTCGSKELFKSLYRFLKRYGPIYKPEIDDVAPRSFFLRHFLRRSEAKFGKAQLGQISVQYFRFHPWKYEGSSDLPIQSRMFLGLPIREHNVSETGSLRSLTIGQCAAYMCAQTGSTLDDSNFEIVLRKKLDCRLPQFIIDGVVTNILSEVQSDHTLAVQTRLFYYGHISPQSFLPKNQLFYYISKKEMQSLRDIFDHIDHVRAHRWERDFIQEYRDLESLVNQADGFGVTPIIHAAISWPEGYHFLRSQAIIQTHRRDQRGLTAAEYAGDTSPNPHDLRVQQIRPLIAA